MDETRPGQSFLKKLWKTIWPFRKTGINVYFVSGMCYNCKAFDKLTLPAGYRKIYIEWDIPHPGETLDEYTRNMARHIDTKHPFVLIGYSFGGVIVQEMAKFLNPTKVILISTFKSRKETPTLFRLARTTGIVEKAPASVFSYTDLITNAFNKVVYDLPVDEFLEYMTVNDPVYIKWAAKQITNWQPGDEPIQHLFHIHGTKDQIFPYSKAENVYPVEGGDHLMVLKQADKVSVILNLILTKKE